MSYLLAAETDVLTRTKFQISHPRSCDLQIPLHSGLLTGGSQGWFPRLLSTGTGSALLGSGSDRPSLVQQNHFEALAQPVLRGMALSWKSIFHCSYIVSKTISPALSVNKPIIKEGSVILPGAARSGTTFRHVVRQKKWTVDHDCQHTTSLCVE